MRSLTVAALLALTLVACGGDGSSQQAATTTGQGTATTGATTTTAEAADLPYEVDCVDNTLVAHKPEGLVIVKAMVDAGWCGEEVQTMFDNEDDPTVEDCADMAADADRLLEVLVAVPDDQLRSSYQAVAGVIKGSAEACVEQGSTFALMGMQALSGYAGAAEARMAELGIQTINEDGESSGYKP